MLGDITRLRAIAPSATIALDWNGTTVNDADRSRAALNATLRAYNLAPLDAATFSARFQLPLSALLGGLGVNPADIAGAIDHLNGQMAAGAVHLGTGAEELLRARWALGAPTGVISAAPVSIVQRDADALGIGGHLRFVIGDAHPKSAPLRDLAVTHERPVVYVGDTEYDVTEALAAGAIPVGFAGGYRPPEALLAAGALAVITDLALLLG